MFGVKPVADGLVASRVSSIDAGVAHAERRAVGVPSARTISIKSDVFVERASATRLAAVCRPWRDLVARALEPNVFMDPAVLSAAMSVSQGRKIVVLLAWDSAHPNDRLLGVWSFAVGRALLPVKVLIAPAVPHAYLAHPVIDAGAADAVLHAMLDVIARSADLPKIIALNAMHSDGATMAALDRVMAQRGAPRHVFATRQRPVLLPGCDGKSYFEAALSASSRKKLRQHRRRLAEQGDLQLRTFAATADILLALDDFLALEAAGWKGRAGDALACSAADAAFARAMLAALAHQRAVTIFGLYLGDKPVSMQIVLRSGAVAYTWKTAYDEAYHDFSPGMLLLEDYTAAFLAENDLARVDSCSFDDSGFMAAWRDRETIADLWLSTGRGASSRFELLALMQAKACSARGHVKSLYNNGLRRWPKRRS